MRGHAGGQRQEDFHIELLKLRQNWRLKKVRNSILVDLSYRKAASQFKPVLFYLLKIDLIIFQF